MSDYRACGFDSHRGYGAAAEVSLATECVSVHIGKYIEAACLVRETASRFESCVNAVQLSDNSICICLRGETVDTLGSGLSAHQGVWVRLPPGVRNN